MNRKIIILSVVILIVIIADLFLMFGFKKKEVLAPGSSQLETMPPPFGAASGDQSGITSLPKPNGNIDDTLKAIDTSLINEESSLSGENQDANSVNSGIQALDNFGQTYDESEF